MARGLCGILVVAFLIGGVSRADSTADSRLLAASVIKSLQNSDFQVVSKAAGDAATCMYQEVADALIKQLERQDIRTGDSAFAFVIDYAIKSLGKSGTSYQVQSLTNAKPNMARILTGNKLSTRIFASLEIALNTMNTRTTPLQMLDSLMLASPAVAPLQPFNGASSTPSSSRTPLGPNKTVHELVQASGANHKDKEEALKFLASMEKNLYDEAMNLKNSNEPLPNFTGRDDDLEKLLQAMLRREKSHALILGKAGIGKTTLVRMLQNGWIENNFSYPGLLPPIVLELSILDVTNPADPTVIKQRIYAANRLAEILNRDILLFLDESQVATELTKHAIKSFLTEASGLTGSRVHLVWATTSNESKRIVADPAFARRWVTITLEEFSEEQAIEAVQKANLGAWKNKHSGGGITFAGISDDAYSFGNRYRHLEQPHAGNPTALKEILEGAVVYRKRQLEALQKQGKLTILEAAFTLQSSDIRNYLKFQKGYQLIPGDPDFDHTFERLWSAFRQEYLGQDGAMVQLKSWLRAHFSTLDRDMLLVIGNFGPPSAGKSFLAGSLAKYFFKGAIQPINAGMFSDGHPLNTLIGSPTGLEGSAEELGLLPKFIREHPNGGIFVIEEADYLPQQVLDFLVDTITRRQFTDNRGQTWDMNNYIIQLNSNIGQEYLIPTDMKTRLTWDEYRSREMALTHRIFSDGQELNVVRPEKLDQIMKTFVTRVAKGRSHGEVDSSDHQQKGIKLLRRIKPMYSLLPSEEQLRMFGLNLVERYKQEKLKDYGVRFEISPDVVDAVMNLKFYRFEQGYSYVESHIKHDLLAHLNSVLDRKGETITVSVQDEKIPAGKRVILGKKLTLQMVDEQHSYVLDPTYGASDNLWFSNAAIRERVNTYASRMSQLIKGQKKQIEYMAALLQQKVFNWNVKLNIAQIGTSGNGKTEFGYASAEVLFGSREAAFKISGINTWADLQNHFRSPVGFVGSNEETAFEVWFKNRMNAGGGVIILDEILSFDGLNATAIGERINAINKLFDMLDSHTISFKGKPEDSRAFMILLTGNSMQELFYGIDDTPEAEYQIRRRLEGVRHDDIVKFFRNLGLGASQLARFGGIFLNGPLDKSTTLSVAAKDERRAIQDAIQEIAEMYDIHVNVDPAIVAGIVNRVTTVNLGMRHVQAAIHRLVGQPITGILQHLEDATDISARLIDNRIQWFSNGELVHRIGTSVDNSEVQDYRWVRATEAPNAADSTPQLADLEVIPKLKVTNEQLHVVFTHEAKGHWRTGVLLRGKSHAVNISLIPGERSLGHVMTDDKDEVDVTGLNFVMKEIAFLEAGHRAVFQAGYYSLGGGNSGDPEEKRRNDDMFKVDRWLRIILSNQLFEGFNEYSSKRDQQLFMDFIRNVGKGLTDRILRYGERMPIFDSFFTDLLKDRFVGEEKINLFMASLAPGDLPDPDLLYLGSLVRAVIAELKKPAYRAMSSVDRQKIITLANDLVQRSTREIRTLRKDNLVITQKALQIRERALAGIRALTSSCETTLRPLATEAPTDRHPTLQDEAF